MMHRPATPCLEVSLEVLLLVYRVSLLQNPGLEQYAAVDFRAQMFQVNPVDAAGKPLRFGNQAAANFNLTAQTTNLGRVTMAGIVQRVRWSRDRCASSSERTQRTPTCP